MQILAGNRNLAPSFGFKATTPASRIKESGVSHMKSNSQISYWMGIVLLMLTLSLPALAALGGDVSSVQEDQAQMKGTLKTTEADAYTVHEITAPGNTVVRNTFPRRAKSLPSLGTDSLSPTCSSFWGRTSISMHRPPKSKERATRAATRSTSNSPAWLSRTAGICARIMGRAYVPDMVPHGVNVDALQ